MVTAARIGLEINNHRCSVKKQKKAHCTALQILSDLIFGESNLRAAILVVMGFDALPKRVLFAETERLTSFARLGRSYF